MIAIVDYDAGNLHSVCKGVEAVGLRARATARPADLESADAVILPGVGAFPACMARLEERGFVAPLLGYLRGGGPFLGVCLGLQLLFEWGEEGTGAAGLGFRPGRVVAVQAPGRKIPHMGWNAVALQRPSPLFEGIPSGEHFYFVHSFHARPACPEDIVATADYGEPVTAAIGSGRVHAVQFHPEKSSAAGLRLLANFGRLVAR